MGQNVRMKGVSECGLWACVRAYVHVYAPGQWQTWRTWEACEAEGLSSDSSVIRGWVYA